jgi:DNA-binding response OmpR family regulator
MSHRTVLLVEDEPMSQDVLSRRLEAQGYRVISVKDGIECLEWLSQHRADLVLMDISMPRMNGIDCLREIRKTYSYDSLPVIVVSALVDSDDVVAGIEAGANDYVVKPVNFRVLRARIHACLRLTTTVTMLVEAERQRVMVEALSRSAERLATPLNETINTLERVMKKTIADDSAQVELNQTVECLEEVIDVLEQIKQAGQTADVPYTERLKMI